MAPDAIAEITLLETSRLQRAALELKGENITARTAEDLVRSEVFYCVSSLVSTLAAQAGMSPNGNSNHVWTRAETSLVELCSQAAELCYPIADYEEAARETGADIIQRPDGMFWPSSFSEDEGNEPYATAADAARDWCEFRGIEPYDREVFEHWIVSDWLADKLEAKGEKVDKDFAGMTVWARTTTGQGIAMDHVIEQIVAELIAEYGA